MSAASILVIGLAVALALPIIVRTAVRRFDPFEPIVLFAAAYGAMFMARPAYMLVHGELSYGGVDLRDTLPAAVALAAAGGVAFVFGYEIGVGPRVARRLPEAQRVATRVAVGWSIALTLLAALAFLVMTVRPSGLSALRVYARGKSDQAGELLVGSGSYVLYATTLVLPAALCLIALAVRERSRRLAVAAALLTAIGLALTVPFGNRIFLLPFVGGILVFVYAHRHRRPSALLLVALACAALLGSYATGVLRDPNRRPEAGTEFAQLVQHPARVLHPILRGNDAEMAPVLAGALTVIPERLEFRYGGAVLGNLVVRPIPRQLWSGKPRPPGETVVAAVWPGVAEYFHPAFSPLLNLYWDFGVPGVLVGMALFGIACRVLYEWFQRNPDSFTAQLIYAAAVWYVVIGARNDPVDTVVLASFFVLPLVLLERFSAWRRPVVRPVGARAGFLQK